MYDDQLSFDLFSRDSNSNESLNFMDNFEIDQSLMPLFVQENNSGSIHEIKNSTNKTNKNKIFNITKNKEKKNKNNEKNFSNNNLNKKGRKTENDKSERNHNKNSDDNIIRKIKVHIFKYARYIINQNIPKKYPKICKLSYNEIMDLQVEKNKNMFNKKLEDIFSEIEMSPKFKKEKYKNHNKNLIEKINKEVNKNEKLKKIKKILDLTFSGLLEILIGNEEKIKELGDVKFPFDSGKKGAEKFIEFIINDEKKEEKVSKEKLNFLINNYENWFKNKKSRKK